MLKDKIEALKAQIADLKAENEEALEALRIKYLSKKGEITALFKKSRKRIKSLSAPRFTA